MVVADLPSAFPPSRPGKEGFGSGAVRTVRPMSLHRLPARPPRRRRHDVIVVGADPAGVATAMLLARRALRVVLLDRRSGRRRHRPRPPAQRAASCSCSRWGVLDAVVAAGDAARDPHDASATATSSCA